MTRPSKEQVVDGRRAGVGGRVALLLVSASLLVGCAGSPPEEDEMTPEIFRVVLPVSDIDRAEDFYGQVLGIRGERVWSNRLYFRCGEVVLACVDPRPPGDRSDVSPNPDHVYFAVDSLEDVLARCRDAGCNRLDERIATRPWGERSFYAEDPFGNKVCFVDGNTVFVGRNDPSGAAREDGGGALP